MRRRLADVLGKVRAEEDQERQKAREREREQKMGDQRKRQRELDRGLGGNCERRHHHTPKVYL